MHGLHRQAAMGTKLWKMTSDHVLLLHCIRIWNESMLMVLRSHVKYALFIACLLSPSTLGGRWKWLTSLHRFDVISIGPFFKFRTMILEYSYQPLWVVASLWFHAFQCSAFLVEDFDSSPPLGRMLLEHLEQVTPELLVPKTRMWQMREKSCRWHLVTTNFNLWYILWL